MRKSTHLNHSITIIILCSVLIYKINAQDTLWTRRFDLSHQEYAAAVTRDSTDNIVIVGTFQDTAAFISDVLLLKYNQSGNLLWYRLFDTGQIDWGFSVATDCNSNIYVGSYHSDMSMEKPGITKFSSTGETIWSQMYMTLANFLITGICLDSQNNIYACAVGMTGSVSLIAKFDTIGTLLWYRTYRWGNTQTFEDIILDGNGNIYVVGDIDYGPWELLFAKFNSNGDSIWTRRYSENNTMCHGMQLLTDKSDNIVIAGYIGLTNSDALILKYSNSGNLLWRKIINYQTIDRLNRISIDGIDNIFVSGFSGTMWNNCDYLLIKLTPSGETLWTIFHNAGYDDVSAGIVTDRQNNPSITGSSSNGTDYDVLTIKYSGSSGIEMSRNNLFQKEELIRLHSNIISNQQIRLIILKPDKYKILLYDLQGRIVKSVQDGFLNQGSFSFNLGRLSNGIYFLEIKTEKHKHIQKLIINKQ